jgi:endoglucanase
LRTGPPTVYRGRTVAGRFAIRGGGAALLGLLACAAPAAAAPPSVIRTGGPSGPGDPKVAVAAAGAPLAGRAFTVASASGRTVLRGKLRRAKGSAAPWRFAATADLSAVKAPGRYRVRAAGMTSARWTVGAGARSALVRRMLRLFAVQSDGREPNPVFGPAHLKDAIVKGGPLDGQRIDLTGGWRDAGDQLKFASTTAFSVALLHLAARLDPADGAVLRSTSQVGVRWLLKSHPAPGVFIAIVGDERDHVGFRDPASDDANTEPGVGVRFAYPTTSSNVLGSVAAALALAGAQGSGAARDQLIAAAREWYAAGKAADALVPIQDPNISDFYPDNIFTDDMAFGALQLFRATGEQEFLADALAFFARGDDDRQLFSGTVVGAVGPIVAADLCGILGAPAPSDAARQAGCAAVRKVVAAGRERAQESAFGTPGIVTFGWVTDNGGAGAIAAAAGTGGTVADGRSLGAGARDYLLGRNPWGASFLVGPGSRDAKNPHSPVFLKGPPSRLMNGAVEGGIARASDFAGAGLKLTRRRFKTFNSAFAQYEDRRENFVTSEVGLAYSSASILLAASLGR